MKEVAHLRSFIRPFKGRTPRDPRGVIIHNFLFRCHYRFTCALLLAMTALACSRNFVGNINCSVDVANRKVQKAIETFCYFNSAFLQAGNDSDEVKKWIYPGVGPDAPGKPKIHFEYYLWVPFMLFFQALLFYGPYYTWKNLEAGRMKAFVSKFRAIGPGVEGFPSKFISKDRLKVHRDWAKWFVLCELAAGVNLVFNIWLTHVFLKRQFLGLGFNIMSNQVDSLDFLFPKVTKCIFHKFGPSGSIMTHDAICVMGLNYIYEKIYCILWFWLFGLAVLEILSFVWRIVGFTLHSRCYLYNRVIWDFVSQRYIESDSVQFLSKAMCYNDWLLLYYLGRNLDGRIFCTIIRELSEEFGYCIKKKREKEDVTETEEI